MRKEKRDVFAREIWRQRLRGIRWRYAIGLIVFVGVLAYMFDPPVPVGHERGRLLGQRHFQGKFRGNVPYLVVERPNGAIVMVQPFGSRVYADGQELCILVARGALFWGLSVTLADERECASQGPFLPRGPARQDIRPKIL